MQGGGREGSLPFPANILVIPGIPDSRPKFDKIGDFVHQFRRFCQVADGFSSVGWCFLLCPDILFVHKKAVSG